MALITMHVRLQYFVASILREGATVIPSGEASEAFIPSLEPRPSSPRFYLAALEKNR